MEVWILTICLLSINSCEDIVRSIRFSQQDCEILRAAVLDKVAASVMQGRELRCRKMEVVRINELAGPTEHN